MGHGSLQDITCLFFSLKLTVERSVSLPYRNSDWYVCKMNAQVWTVLLGAPSNIFFSYMPVHQCVVKPSINGPLAALFVLTPLLWPRWVLSLQQGAAQLGTRRHVSLQEPDAQRGQIKKKASPSLAPFVLWEVSESLLLLLPEGWARAGSTRSPKSRRCLIALWACRSARFSSAMETGQGSAVTKQFPFVLAVEDDWGKQSPNHPAHLEISSFTFTRLVLFESLLAWKKQLHVLTVDAVAMFLL